MKNTFGKPIIPENETARLQALKELNILDTPPEESLSKLASIVARVFNVPIALISFVAEEKVFFKARYGFKETHADRGVSLCALAILNDDATIFENAKEEPCLLANPLVHGQFGLQFYAGAPLKTPEGFNVGTLCIVDTKQRFFSSEQTQMLEDFALVVMHLVNLRAFAIKGVEHESQ